MKIKSVSEIDAVSRYLSRIGAEVRSLRTAVVKEQRGNYWKDVALIKFSKLGAVECPEAYMPTEAEGAEIKAELLKVEWPSIKPLKPFTRKNLPDELKDVPEENLFEFRNRSGQVIYLQHRRDVKSKDGAGNNKVYIPWTYWDDNEWRRMEPEGPLPIYGIENVKAGCTVFIHEGAKAARFCQRLVNAETFEEKERLKAHPWGEELSGAVHVGWIGGALSPYRTDWSELAKLGVKRAYIVSDNDPPGLSSVPAIAYHLNVPTFHIQFTNEWRPSFDLADPFPADMFKTIDKQTHYVGPSFRSCTHPATWATDLIPNPKGKPSPVLRDHFKELWHYVEEADLFVCTEMPEILRPEAILNKMLSSFSHSQETSKLIVKAFNGRNTKLCYRPDISGRIVTDKTTSAVNLHTSTLVKPKKGDAGIWLKFMDYLLPDEIERGDMLKWCATLIARPGTKMEYGALMVSESQGIGKTTLGSKILAPLVGQQNTSWPTENEIVASDFNSWVANKRLVVVNEIYSGHSWKAYNRLKSIITDKEVTVNQKYQRPYVVENWCHIFACSNSLRALKMEQDDRRWFYPGLAEHGWAKDKFAELNNWLASGGLQIILDWAERWRGGYVITGERAPMTNRKRDLINESRTEAQKEAASLAEAMMARTDPIAVASKDVELWLKGNVSGRIYDTDYEIRKAMRETGAVVLSGRFKIAGRMQYVLCNRAVLDAIEELATVEEKTTFTRASLVNPADVLGSPI